MRLSKSKREALKKLPYQRYLKSHFWREVRKLALERSHNACQLCNAKGRLQVHHRTYENRGYEDQNLQDLVSLCSGCHKKFHNIKRNPTKSKCQQQNTLTGKIQNQSTQRVESQIQVQKPKRKSKLPAPSV